MASLPPLKPSSSPRPHPAPINPRGVSSGRRGISWWYGVLITLVGVIGFSLGAGAALMLANPVLFSQLMQGELSFLPVSTERQQAKWQQLRQQAQPTAETAALVPANNPDPFAISPLARLSYVPSIMYHDVVASRKQVWFDTTLDELREHFEAIRQAGSTPITLEQLYKHLREGAALPDKPILLTFDDGYQGQYDLVFPLLKEYNYPASYFVQTGFVGIPTSKDHFTWEQMREMEASGLVTIDPHTINHPEDLTQLDDAKLKRELEDSKRLMEEKLGHAVNYFAYPAGNRDERVKQAVIDAGYALAFTMDTGFTGQSPNLLEVKRFNQFRFREALVGSRVNLTGESLVHPLNVLFPLAVQTEDVQGIRLSSIRGGRAATVHADQRYDVRTLADRYQATAAINGGFFSIPWINSASNVMVGPVLSAATRQFIPGRPEDIASIQSRPLVLLGNDRISFIPFDADTMNDLAGIQQLMPDVTDLFVAGVWLVKDGKALTEEEINTFRLTSATEFRPRAFLGVDQQGLLTVGATSGGTNSAMLAQMLPGIGIQEAVLLDSGFSTSLLYQDRVLASGHQTRDQPSRPVPHAILLYDLPQLWAQQAGSSDSDPMQRLVRLVPEAEQATAQSQLEAVLQGQAVLQRRQRGSGIRALQQALVELSVSRGLANPLPSGVDGVYGGELARALVNLEALTSVDTGIPAATPAPRTSQDPLLSSSGGWPTPVVAPTLPGAAFTTPENQAEVNEINRQTLETIMDQLKQSRPSVLVSVTVPRQALDPALKPTRKFS